MSRPLSASTRMKRRWADPVWAAQQRVRIANGRNSRRSTPPATVAPVESGKKLNVRILRPNGVGTLVEKHELTTWGDFVDLITEQYHQTPLDEVLITIK